MNEKRTINDGRIDIRMVETRMVIKGKSNHIQARNRNRRVLIAEDLCRKENAKHLQSFYVDKHHPKGAELHHVMDNGVIVVTNWRTQKVVTVLIGRENQIKRYWEESNSGQAPAEVLEKAREHKKRGYNRV